MSCYMCDSYTWKGPSIFVREKSIISSKRMLYKDYDCKGLVKEKSLVVGLKGLGAKTNSFHLVWGATSSSPCVSLAWNSIKQKDKFTFLLDLTFSQRSIWKILSSGISFCSAFKSNWRFGGICRLHHRSLKISQARNQSEAGGKQNFTLILLLYK
jgi:hypothetical protein